MTVGGAGDVAAGITVFLDFQCPFCQRFEAQYGEDITTYVTEGRLQVTYRPVSFWTGSRQAATTRHGRRPRCS